MKLLKKPLIWLCIGLSVMTLFVSAGYAALTGHLEISGSAKWNEPALVFIQDIRVIYSTNVTGTPSVEKTGFVVYEHGTCVLKTQGTGNNSAGGSVTIQVTVKNNSGASQYFLGHQSTPKLSSNCVISYSGIALRDQIAHGAIKTFTITYQNTSRWNTVSLTDLESTLLFSPNVDEEFTAQATASIAEIFMYVLSNRGIDGEGTGITFKNKYIKAEDILSTIKSNMESVDTGGYMGNVGNASDDRKALIAAIFGDNIVMQIGNQYYSVSLLIKNQQIDGKGENDMVIYVTADQLTVGGGRWQNNAWRELKIVPVYGIVYINNGKDGWSMCEHLFMGEAPVCDFGGALGTDKVGNFNTNLWNSTEYADVTDKSGGSISQNYITTNGELDEAYQKYAKENP